MDLLSLTLRSIDLRDSILQNDDFLDSNREVGAVERLPKQIKEEPKTSIKEESKELKTISLDEVAWHDTVDNCWVVIYDFVYDCTDLLTEHPGGSDVILEYAGRDATLAFIGTGHSRAARSNLERYLIGELPPEERIFRVPDGLKIDGF
ncbi:Cytochrome b5 [Dufourea novaeangliae]|uniref:Cytochrome b5 n=2 Tax=Dufourea novaeangliae TaxID=178035 RepID=A0A154PM82_DUFNO|nr:Cytochrome b5 [Dufourea novaeangliae]